MSQNLSNRIITSIILLFILSLCLLSNKFLWIYLLTIASIISFYEFNNLIKKIYKKKKDKIYLFNILSLIYLSFFVYSGYFYYSTVSLFLIISICILSDTGGYLVGKSIGGKKLTKISPNKTISGSIGSFIFSLISIIIFVFIYENIIKIDFISVILDKKLSSLFFICLFLSLICQLGDLLISYFKRRAKVKDTGTILPGHGGLLDRIDGFIFVLPVAYISDRLFF